MNCCVSAHDEICLLPFSSYPVPVATCFLNISFACLALQGGAAGYSGSVEGSRPVSSSHAAGSHRSAFAAESPSARWSSSSPSASWGASQTAGQQPSATQAEDRGSGKGFVETLKEYLPGSHQPQNGADLVQLCSAQHLPNLFHKNGANFSLGFHKTKGIDKRYYKLQTNHPPGCHTFFTALH